MARLCVALILVFFLLISVGIEQIVHNLLNINPLLVVTLLFCNILLFLTGAINIWLILNVMHPISLSTFIQAYSYSWMLSLITPGQAGDISLLIFLKKYEIPLQRTGIAYALDKMITLGFFFFIAWYGSYKIFPELKNIWFPIITFIFVALIFILLLVNFTKFTKFLLCKMQLLHGIANEYKKFRKRWYLVSINILFTIIKWLILSLCYKIAFLAFAVYVKWPEIGIIPILSTLVGYIPVSIGGIGTVELTASHLFSKIGIEQSGVLSAYFLLRLLQFVMAIIFLILFSVKKNNYKQELTKNSFSSKDE